MLDVECLKMRDIVDLTFEYTTFRNLLLTIILIFLFSP